MHTVSAIVMLVWRSLSLSIYMSRYSYRSNTDWEIRESDSDASREVYESA